jgi:hypothetical protein
MGKGWPFRKTKHDNEDGSSREGKKKEQYYHYVQIDYAHGLFNKDCAVPWPNVSMPVGWLLNSRGVPVPPVSC